MKVKKNGKIKFLSVILSMILLMGIVPTTVFATSDELWINGVDIIDDADNTIECDEGNAVYDKTTNTLTLNNATISTGYNGIGIYKAGAADSTNSLNIVLYGENYITTNDSNQIDKGIYSMGKVNIKGTGSLAISTATNSASITFGIFAWSGCSIKNVNIFLNDTSTLTDHEGSAIDVNGWTSSFSATNATITVDGYDIGANVPSGDVTINGSSFTVTNANRGISGGNEIDNFEIVNSTVNVTATGENALGLLNGHEILIDNSSIILSSDSSNAIYTDDAITIINNSNLNVTGYYPALFSTLDTTITDSMVVATSTDDSAIFSKGNIIISGTSEITAKGYYSAINSINNITINNGKVNATSTNDMGIWTRGILTINGGEIYAKGAAGCAAIGARYEKQGSDTDAVAKIVINSNYADINGGKVSVSDWFTGTISGNPYTGSWTSFIEKNDENILATNRSNALNEVTIKIKGANYTLVDEAIEKANKLNAADYKDFSAVTAAINAVVLGKDITQQETVNGYATAIENAIKVLELKGANYTLVEKAIEKANKLNAADYKDFSAVTAAINAVVLGKDITQQETVNGYATAIENAIKTLVLKDTNNTFVNEVIKEPELKGANYTLVDEIIEKANKLNPDDYKDFSAVTAAINAVVLGKNITEQEIVNGYVTAIENAIKSLELKLVNPPVIKPEIIEDANQSIEHGKDATFTSNADLTDFIKVLIDGKELSSDNYIIKNGTIVILKADFIKTLSEGKHSLEIVSTSGSAETEFTVSKPTNLDTNNPQTRDNFNVVLWVTLIFVSAGGALTLLLKRKTSVK